jgi:nitrogen fixation/metabolism regulation signal transduction histidine kinase
MTLRLRLAMFYAVSLLLCGALLLGIAYRVVSASVNHYEANIESEVRQGLAEQRERDLQAGRPPAPPLVARAVPPEERQLRQAARARALQEQRSELARAFLWALGGLALVAALVGWLVAGRALRPVRRVTATARKITEHNLGKRIALAGPRD